MTKTRFSSLLAALLGCLGASGAVASPPAVLPGSAALGDSGRGVVAERQSRDGDIRALQRDLRDRSPERRRGAVRRLLERGDVAALDLVLEALADVDGMVADEAQLGLPGFGIDGALARVLGKGGLRSKDPWTARRAAEALGRWDGDVPLKPLAAALDRRRPELARAVLWSIERLAIVGRLDAAGRGDPWRDIVALTRKGAPDPVRAAALAALAAGAPGRVEETLKALGRGVGPEVRAAALAVTLDLGLGDGTRALTAALSDGTPSIRAFAARLAATRADRSVLVAMAERLELEPRPCIKDAVARGLAEATGLKHGMHVPSWRRAVEELPGSWRPVEEAPSTERAADPVGQSVAALGRMDPRSDRLAILVDFSGSLWNQRDDGTRRKDALDPQVEALLGALDGEARFLLVPYTADNHPFEEEPVEATTRNVGRAQEFFRRATMRGKGDVWGAFELALSLDEIDRIVVVTDGAPTGGRHWNIGLIGDLLVERTRFRPVTVDMVLLDASRGLQRRWAAVVDRLGGRLMALDR